MTWLRLEDNMLDHPKWRRAIRLGGDAVLAVWVRLVSWSSRNLTDGVIPADMVQEVAETRGDRSRRRALEGLIQSGLLVRDEQGRCTIADYLQRNPSKAEVLAERERRSRSQRIRRGSPSVTGHEPPTDPTCNSVPARPGPARPNPGDQSAARSERARAHDPPPSSSTRVSEPPPTTARVYSLPSEAPPEDYLDAAVMAGVSREQAASTWEHYLGAGLPERGVERLHRWLVQRAKERSNATSRASPSPRRSRGNPDVFAYALDRISEEEAKERVEA